MGSSFQLWLCARSAKFTFMQISLARRRRRRGGKLEKFLSMTLDMERVLVVKFACH